MTYKEVLYALTFGMKWFWLIVLVGLSLLAIEEKGDKILETLHKIGFKTMDLRRFHGVGNAMVLPTQINAYTEATERED